MNSSSDSSAGPQRLHETVMDVGEQRIARVYAEALLGAAERSNLGEAPLAELDALFNDVFAHNPEFESFLTSSALTRRVKKVVLDRTLASRVSDTLLNFLHVVNDHERLHLLPGIRRLARELAEERAGRLHVHVTSAVPLSDEQRTRLLDEIRSVFKKKTPILNEAIEAELLGGLVVRIGDWLYDASVRTRLDTIRKQLMERGSHVPNPVG